MTHIPHELFCEEEAMPMDVYSSTPRSTINNSSNYCVDGDSSDSPLSC